MADHESLSSHRVRSLAQVAGLEPTAGLQYGLRITRTESISLAGYFTMTSDSGEVSYRRSFRCTYRPADDAMLSWHELPGNPGQSQRPHEILDESDSGKLASYQSAAGLQVTSARLTDRPFSIHIPNGPGACPSAAGIVEADEIDVARDDPWQFRNVLVH